MYINNNMLLYNIKVINNNDYYDNLTTTSEYSPPSNEISNNVNNC